TISFKDLLSVLPSSLTHRQCWRSPVRWAADYGRGWGRGGAILARLEGRIRRGPCALSRRRRGRPPTAGQARARRPAAVAALLVMRTPSFSGFGSLISD